MELADFAGWTVVDLKTDRELDEASWSLRSTNGTVLKGVKASTVCRSGSVPSYTIRCRHPARRWRWARFLDVTPQHLCALFIRPATVLSIATLGAGFAAQTPADLHPMA